jgi:peptide/nickel transport system permease protein
VLRLTLRRLAFAVPTLFGVSIVVFALILLAPGDPAQTLAGPFATPEVVEAYRQKYNLDDPIPVQYLKWLGGVLHGDLGFSPNLNQDVGPLVIARLGNTLMLITGALLLTLLIGITLGLIAGRRPTSRLAKTVMVGNVVTATIPEYLLGMLLVLIFSQALGWFPSGGMENLRHPGGLPDHLYHLVLPMIAVAAGPTMIVARMTRASTLEISQQDYVRVAQSVGIRPGVVSRRYVLWNALPPIIGVSGLQVGALLSGALFVEVVFSWPGIGDLLYRALVSHDVFIIQAVTLLVAVSFILVNLVADLLIGIISPRTRADAAAGGRP